MGSRWMLLCVYPMCARTLSPDLAAQGRLHLCCVLLHHSRTHTYIQPRYWVHWKNSKWNDQDAAEVMAVI